MHVLVVGSGGREHALCWKIARSPRVAKVFCAPGNAGTPGVAENLAISAADHAAVIAACRTHRIDLVVVAPDDCLAAGLVDDLTAVGIAAFGPTRDAARFESSKAYAKAFMLRHGIPTARASVFTDAAQAKSFLITLPVPIVVKADGLALGKGVIVAQTHSEAESAVDAMLNEGRFGEAGSRVLIEEFLVGWECSAHALISNGFSLLFPVCQDHKRVGDGDTGPNTGGMGTCCPSPFADGNALARIEAEVLAPFVAGCAAEGIAYSGLLFPGLMLTAEGPRVIEFNCRFGDPETQVLMRMLESDLVDLLEATVQGNLQTVRPTWRNGAAVCVVAASGGYPGSYRKGLPVTGIDDAQKLEEVTVFHAGTTDFGKGPVTSGGRVLGVTAWGENLQAARDQAYAGMNATHFEGRIFRSDIPVGL